MNDVHSVTESWQEMTAGQSTTQLRAGRVFEVTFENVSNPIVLPLLAQNASDGTLRVPLMYEVHPFNPWLFVQDKSVETRGPSFFRVIVTYGTVHVDPASQQPASPLDRAPVITWGHASGDEPIDRDINNQPITNSAGESFDPPITRGFYDKILRIERNENLFKENRAAEYEGAVNSDRFFGFGRGIVRCNEFNGRSVRAASLKYWEVTYEFQIRADGWQRRILDQGFRYRAGTDDDGQPIFDAIVDSEGVPMSQPTLLDGNGYMLSAGVDPVFLQYEIYKQLPFSVLGF